MWTDEPRRTRPPGNAELLADGGAVPNAALLWDLDNVITKSRDVPDLARLLGRIAGPQAVKVAAGRRGLARRWTPLLSESGFDVISGGTSKSGADRQLLVSSRQLSRQGIRTFIVVSNDHYLARVARLGALRVVTLDGAQVSQKLAIRADSVLVLAGTIGVPWRCVSGAEP